MRSVWSVPTKSKSNDDPGLWVRRRSQWVRFEVEALGSWCNLKSKLWVRGAKSLGCRQSRSSWVAGNGLSLLPLSLSLSLSLCGPARSHSHTPSLASSADRGASVCGSFRLARCVGWSSQALCASKRGSACERGMENVWSENLGWKSFSLVLAYFTVKLKIFSVWPNLPSQPNMLFSGKWFPNFVFNQNKRSLSLTIFGWAINP